MTTDTGPTTAIATGGEDQPKLEITTSRGFEAWLRDHKTSLAFTTYQVGKLFFIGTSPEGRLSIFNRTLERCMGLALAGDRLAVATLYQIICFEDAAARHSAGENNDALFVPQLGFFTGDLDVHDVAIGGNGEVFFANTLFSCVAEASATHSFRPVWTPPFIDRLAAEDRCHLNGLALENGAPRYVTAVAATNIADGWRDHRQDGGVVIDVQTGDVVLAGLSMPHSPRLHDGRLWLLDSGTGHFGCLISETGAFHPVTFCPGYLRGLTFVGGHAVVGLSLPRGNKTFAGLPLEANLAHYNVEPRAGLYVIDLATGDVVHWLRIEGLITELFDVVAMPGRLNPAAIGFRNDEVRRVVSIEE